MNFKLPAAFALAVLTALPAFAQGELPNGPGKDTVLKLCGSCHSPNIVSGRGMSRSGWGEVVASMVSRGAKGTPAEFSTVVDYLSREFPPKQAGTSAPRRRGGFSVGPNDKQVVDVVAANRGRQLYDAHCTSCHGPKARGTAAGPDLVRSVTVMHDRYGNVLGPFLVSGHPTKGASYTESQIQDLSHFLHQELNDTLRSGPYTKVLNVLTGDPQAGKEYFAEKCAQCHSPAKDLAGIAAKYDPPTLQQRFLFPQVVSFTEAASSKIDPTTVTVTVPGESPVTGVLERIDDFDVSLRDSTGVYRTWKRTPDVTVQVHNPYSGHIALLDEYTDRDIHNVVAYLETLK